MRIVSVSKHTKNDRLKNIKCFILGCPPRCLPKWRCSLEQLFSIQASCYWKISGSGGILYFVFPIVTRSFENDDTYCMLLKDVF